MRRKLSAALAALGVAGLLAVPLTGPAGAAETPLPIFDSTATGQGLVLAAGVRPSILETAGQAGFHFAQTTFNSAGGGRSQSLAAPVFPGSFAVGALTANVGCGGFGKMWVEARFPPSEHCNTRQSDNWARLGRSSLGEAFGAPELDDAVNGVLDRADAGSGDMHVTAELGRGTADISTTTFSLSSAAGDPPVIALGSLEISTGGAREGGSVGQRARVVAKDVSLLGGSIRIAAIESIAEATSDGVAGAADASLRFIDVTVLVNGERHRATIDSDGIHVDDPELEQEQELGLSEEIEDTLLRAGLSISASSPVRITDGASAEATVGGLILSIRGTVPSVVIPEEVAPVYAMILDQIPTLCLNDPPLGAPLPLCFGSGVIPAGGSSPFATLTLGSASAFAVGAEASSFLPGPIDIPDPPSPPVGPVTTQPFTPPVLQPDTPPAGPPSAAPSLQPQAPLIGLVAGLSDAALAWSGAIFLILAFALAAGPSLRHGGTG